MGTKRHLLSYLAGIFDGEGCVSIIRYKRKQGHCYNLRVEMQMVEEIIPRLFQATFGGNIYKVSHKNPRQRTSYKWYCASENAETFLMDILPYAIIKHPQIEVALHFASDMGYHKCGKPLSNQETVLREADYILMRELKRQPLTPALGGKDIE